MMKKERCKRCSCYRDEDSFFKQVGGSKKVLTKDVKYKNCFWCRSKKQKHYRKNKERYRKRGRERYRELDEDGISRRFWSMELSKWYYHNVQKIERRKISNRRPTSPYKYGKRDLIHPWK